MYVPESYVVGVFVPFDNGDELPTPLPVAGSLAPVAEPLPVSGPLTAEEIITGRRSHSRESQQTLLRWPDGEIYGIYPSQIQCVKAIAQDIDPTFEGKKLTRYLRTGEAFLGGFTVEVVGGPPRPAMPPKVKKSRRAEDSRRWQRIRKAIIDTWKDKEAGLPHLTSVQWATWLNREGFRRDDNGKYVEYTDYDVRNIWRQYKEQKQGGRCASA